MQEAVAKRLSTSAMENFATAQAQKTMEEKHIINKLAGVRLKSKGVRFPRLSTIKEVLIFTAAYSVLLVIAMLCDYLQSRQPEKD